MEPNGGRIGAPLDLDGGGALDLHGRRPVLVHGRRSCEVLEADEVRRRRLEEKQGRGLGVGGDEVPGVIHKSVIIWANGGRG